MSAATTPGNFTDGQVTITDGGALSEVCTLFMGDFSVSLKPDGREIVAYEAQGAMTGLRKEARFYPTITFTAQQAEFNADFEALAMGEIAAFTSVTADIGDVAAFDLSFDGSYSTSTRTIAAQDCHVDTFDMAQGSPSNRSFSIICRGPLTINGTTYVSSR